MSQKYRQPIKGLTVLGSREFRCDFYSIGFLALSVGRSVQRVLVWEKKGIIPPTPFRNYGGERLYTQEMIEHIRKATQNGVKGENAKNIRIDLDDEWERMFGDWRRGMVRVVPQ